MGSIRYEYNPPKIEAGIDVDAAIAKSLQRLLTIAPKCDAVHITENVLGYERVSPITMGRKLKEAMPKIPITVSLRVRDKTENEISTFVEQCIKSKFDGILILMGDPSRDGKPNTGQKPSSVTERLKELGIDSRIDLYMSISNEPDSIQIQKKIAAQPNGLFTQVVQNTQQVKKLTKYMYGLRIIPVILHPSVNNQKAAEFLNLNLDEYAHEFDKFVKDVYDITNDVLITSPNDFAAANVFFTYARKGWDIYNSN